MSIVLPDFDSDDGFDDPELQAEHDRLVAQIEARVLPRRPLAPDLEELTQKIGDVTAVRNLGVDDPTPYMFGRFEAYGVRRGGMGLVIEANDPQLDRKVAIKLWMRSGPAAHLALITEAQTLAKLRHPNVVAIYQPGVWNDRVYFVMEWIEGVDGHDWMLQPRSWQEVLAVYIAAGTGLAAAHDAAIQHRDFKPSNILIGNDGHVVVADFGVADSLHAIPDAEEPRLAGTPSYMAPERLRGKRGDARSDQYSFCVAVWQALFGQRPYEGRTGDELLGAIERGEIQETPGVDVPTWLRVVLRKGLANEPDSRFRDMHELLDALRSGPPDAAADEVEGEGVVVLDGRALDGRRAGAVWPYYCAIAMLMVLVGVLGYIAWSQPPPPPPASEQTVSTVVEVTPYQTVLGLIAKDEFTEALGFWGRHRSELTEEQSLAVAETCLSRAKRLQSIDRAAAEAAALLVTAIGEDVRRSGRTAVIQQAGGRLAAEATALVAVGHPGSAD